MVRPFFILMRLVVVVWLDCGRQALIVEHLCFLSPRSDMSRGAGGYEMIWTGGYVGVQLLLSSSSSARGKSGGGQISKKTKMAFLDVKRGVFYGKTVCKSDRHCGVVNYDVI